MPSAMAAPLSFPTGNCFRKVVLSQNKAQALSSLQAPRVREIASLPLNELIAIQTNLYIIVLLYNTVLSRLFEHNCNKSPESYLDRRVKQRCVDACLQHALTCSMQPTADPRICLSTTNLYPND
ncbi:hypothetical protein EVAR_24707_1 [Eumeta japonica]|uniref:Uncharacterized protein n=1 Tax=Eumeta variegata TaxID=151549 RepID=A0A4C1VG71_EUMVA|nr:hypothetical protein EVAR_24707_1 [Eumeta japonica]